MTEALRNRRRILTRRIDKMPDRDRRKTKLLILGGAMVLTLIYIMGHPSQMLRIAATITLPIWVLYIWFLLSRIN